GGPEGPPSSRIRRLAGAANVPGKKPARGAGPRAGPSDRLAGPHGRGGPPGKMGLTTWTGMPLTPVTPVNMADSDSRTVRRSAEITAWAVTFPVLGTNAATLVW